MSLQDDIYTGYWVDHSRGSVLGATVTLSSSRGSILTSAATVLVTLIGGAVWTIVAFWIHQVRATGEFRDEYEAQTQVVLRNAGAPDMTIWTLLRLAQTWSGHKQHVWRKTLWLANAPTLVWTGFLVAGVFVGRIATSSDQVGMVLLNRGDCGYIYSAAPDSVASAQTFAHIDVNVSTLALQYARQCYDSTQDSAISCASYPKQALPYNVSYNQPCPFPGDAVCFSDEASAAITFATGKLDSHEDFGINAPKSDRLILEKRATCAPLRYDLIDQFIETEIAVAADPAFPNATNEEYHLGTWNQSDYSSNYTFQYVPAIRWWGVGSIGYGMLSFQSLVPHNLQSTNWVPAYPLNETSGDLTMFAILPNGITFSEPVEDPMFRTNSTPSPFILSGSAYKPERNAYIMTCTEEYQVCNPNSEVCTGFQAMRTLGDDFLDTESSPANTFTPLKMNPSQNATAWRLLNAADDSTMYNAVHSVPNPLLASSYLVTATGSQALPNNHWQAEVEGWFQATLAKLQMLQIYFVHIPLEYTAANEALIYSPDTSAAEQQCSQQRIRSPQHYQNYNFFALILLLICGIVFPAIALCVRGLHAKLPRINTNGFRYLSFQAEGALQLHRMAMEGSGYGGWKSGMVDNPYTELAQERLPQIHVEHDDDGERTLRYPRAGSEMTMDAKDSDSKCGSEQKNFLSDNRELLSEA